MLFTLANLYDHKLRKKGKGSGFRVMAGTICAILSVGPDWAFAKQTKELMEELTDLSIQTFIELSKQEDNLIF